MVALPAIGSAFQGKLALKCDLNWVLELGENVCRN